MYLCRIFNLPIGYELCEVDLLTMLLSSEEGGKAACRTVWRVVE